MNLDFTERQRTIITSALTLVATVVLAGVLVWLFTLAISFFQFFSNVFLPLAVAAIFAVMLKPYYRWWVSVVRSESTAVLLVLVSVVLPLVGVGWFFGAVLVEQGSGLLRAIPGWIESITIWLQARQPQLIELWENYAMGARLETWLESSGGWLAAGAAEMGTRVAGVGSAIFRFVTGLLGWVVFPVYFVFLLMIPSVPSHRLEAGLPFLKKQTRDDVIYLAREFVGIMVAFFRGQLVIAFLQGLLYGIGFAVLGLKYGLLLGLIFGLLNIIPYLGNILGLLVILPLAYFQEDGGWGLLLGASVVFAVTQVIESYVLTPRIMGKQTGLNPGVIIFAMFFWGTALGGIFGMILAIPLTAFLVMFWRLLRTRYMREWV